MPGTGLQALGKDMSMHRQTKPLLLAILLFGFAFTPAKAAEREQVRIVVNLMAAVKMPYPEDLHTYRA